MNLLPQTTELFLRADPRSFLTSAQLQAHSLLDVVEPARHLYTAAVHATVTLIGVCDGQGHIAPPDNPQKCVFSRLPGDHFCSICVDKLFVALGVGACAFAPAHAVAVPGPGWVATR